MGSLWGQLYDCDRCDFVFSSSHAYDLNGQVEGLRGHYSVICVHCQGRYYAMTSGVRGAEDGERLPLYRRAAASPAKRKRGVPAPCAIEDTGAHVDYYQIEGTRLGDLFTLSSTACPDCAEAGTLRVDFAAGDTCPICRQGRLRSQSAT